MTTTEQLDINEYIKYAESHVGETHELKYESAGKWAETAGRFTITGFEVSENPHFGVSWSGKKDNTPDIAELGFYYIRFDGSKWYNGKTIKCPVIALVQTRKRDNLNEWCKTKALYIRTENAETGKRLKAYNFGLIDSGTEI